jgi:hypothetical protein
LRSVRDEQFHEIQLLLRNRKGERLILCFLPAFVASKQFDEAVKT